MELQPIAWTTNSEGVAVLQRATPREDGGQDDKRIWELTFLTDLTSVEQTAAMALFPAGRQYHSGAVEEVATTTLKVKPLKGQMVHLDFYTEKEAGKRLKVLEELAGEVRFVALNLTTQARVMISRVNLRGVDVDKSNAIVGLIGKRVAVTVKQDQQPLFALAGQADKPEIGQLVSGKTGDQTALGIMIREDGGKIVVDDFGVTYLLDSYASTLWVESVDGTETAEHESQYADAVREKDGVPTWNVLLQAMTAAWSGGDIAKPEGHTVYLNDSVIERAISLHEVEDELPGEAGDPGPDPEAAEEAKGRRKPPRQRAAGKNSK